MTTTVLVSMILIVTAAIAAAAALMVWTHRALHKPVLPPPAFIDNPDYWQAVSRSCQEKAERRIPLAR